MAQKRTQYIKTSSGIEKQLIASAADIVELDSIEGLNATNVQEAIEELKDIANTGGVTGVKGSAESSYRTGTVNITAGNIGLGNLTNDAQVKRSEMGVASGVATLGTDGKVPTAQLPSYVDDVLEYDKKALFPATGESGKIYVDKEKSITYRWGGSTYVEISPSLALGETSSTAYAGDKGKALADRLTEAEALASENKDKIDGLLEVGDDLLDGSLSVAKADTLTNGRKISLTGDATGNTTFDGSTDKSITVTLANSGVTPGTYSAVAVDAKGRVTAGSQLIEWGVSGQTVPSTNLAVGGLFFMLVE
jgi:hypothetical protein